jgi:hypothetical protein
VCVCVCVRKRLVRNVCVCVCACACAARADDVYEAEVEGTRGGGHVRGGLVDLEDVHGAGLGGGGEEGRVAREGDAKDSSRVAAPSELVQLLRLRDRKDADHRALRAIAAIPCVMRMTRHRRTTHETEWHTRNTTNDNTTQHETTRHRSARAAVPWWRRWPRGCRRR